MDDALVFLANFTNEPLHNLLDLDLMSFNALLESAVRVDSTRWIQTAWVMRAAQHAEGKDFTKMLKETWGKNLEEVAPARGIQDLIRDFGSGI